MAPPDASSSTKAGRRPGGASWRQSTKLRGGSSARCRGLVLLALILFCAAGGRFLAPPGRRTAGSERRELAEENAFTEGAAIAESSEELKNSTAEDAVLDGASEETMPNRFLAEEESSSAAETALYEKSVLEDGGDQTTSENTTSIQSAISKSSVENDKLPAQTSDLGNVETQKKYIRSNVDALSERQSEAQEPEGRGTRGEHITGSSGMQVQVRSQDEGRKPRKAEGKYIRVRKPSRNSREEIVGDLDSVYTRASRESNFVRRRRRRKHISRERGSSLQGLRKVPSVAMSLIPEERAGEKLWADVERKSTSIGRQTGADFLEIKPAEKESEESDRKTKSIKQQEEPLKVYMYNLPSKYNWEIRVPPGKVLAEKEKILVEGPGIFRTDEFPQEEQSGWGWLNNGSLFLPSITPDPLDSQYGGEYYMLISIYTGGLPSFVRVAEEDQADAYFVPFFSSLSYVTYRGSNTHRRDRDEELQEELVEWLTQQRSWRRTGGKRHFIPAFHPHSMEHALPALRSASFLISDLWRPSPEDFARFPTILQTSSPVHEDAFSRLATTIQKDVVSPYNIFLEKHSNDTGGWSTRPNLLYFRGGTKRKRRGVLREKLLHLLQGEAPDVVFEEAVPWAPGAVSAAEQGMRTSKYCLVPAGDMPATGRLFDALASHCVPVIISDLIELPYEDVLDYTDFAVFVKESKALAKGYLTTLLRAITKERWEHMWHRLLEVDNHFLYSHPCKVGGAEDMLWQSLRRRVAVVRGGEDGMDDGNKSIMSIASMPLRRHRRSLQA